MSLELERRIERALSDASYAFWETLAEQFPECQTGDLTPMTTIRFQEAARAAVYELIVLNFPKENEDGKA
jgi:hypothetical protein